MFDNILACSLAFMISYRYPLFSVVNSLTLYFPSVARSHSCVQTMSLSCLELLQHSPSPFVKLEYTMNTLLILEHLDEWDVNEQLGHHFHRGFDTVLVNGIGLT